MSESLKIKWPAKVAIPLYEPRFGEGIEVIPADLGREQRDWLRAGMRLLVATHRELHGDTPSRELNDFLSGAQKALTRYEREVGG